MEAVVQRNELGRFLFFVFAFQEAQGNAEGDVQGVAVSVGEFLEENSVALQCNLFVVQVGVKHCHGAAVGGHGNGIDI